MRPSSVSIPPREEQPTTSPSPSSVIPPSPILWAGDDETDRSYDSSQLQPSPSVMSVAISDATSFRRSSVNKLSTLQVSPSMLTTRTSLHRLVPSPAPRPSESSSSSSIMPSAETISSFSSSFPDTSLSSPSGPSQPSFSSSSIASLPLPAEPEIDEKSVVGRAPRTISTLLDTARVSVRSPSRSPSPTPIPPRIYTVMLEGTIVTSVLSTPSGSGGTDSEQASLRTVSERPLPPTPRESRDFALELDRLAEDLRWYNDVRGQESKEIVDNVKALRDELQGLSDYSRRTRPPNIVTIVERPIAPDPRQMESRSIGGSTEITALRHSSPEEVHESVGVAFTRSSSITSSVESFLSSHHSDDLSLYEYHSASPESPLSGTETEFEDESSFVSSSEVTESEASDSVMPATPAQIMPPLPIPPPEIVPTPSSGRSSIQPTRTLPGVPLVSVDWMAPFNAIMDQLDNLAKKQAATVRKMDSLRAPEYPEIPAIHHKIDRVEDLVRDLIQKFESRPSQPVVVPVPIYQPIIVPPEPRPPSQAATIHDQPPYS